MGATAVVATDGGDALVIATHAVIDSSVERYRSIGLDPAAYRAVIARGVQSPLPSYGPLAALVLQVITPGVTTANLGSLTYKNRSGPVYPLDI